MAKNGYIIGISTDTNVNPTQYWGGVDAVDSIDDAVFIDVLATARIEAGRVQGVLPDKHVEAYPATKTTAHSPALPVGNTGI